MISSTDYLITGGKDLLDIKKFGKTKIVTMAEYRKKLTLE
jgi:predicted nucleic acid-binding protein